MDQKDDGAIVSVRGRGRQLMDIHLNFSYHFGGGAEIVGLRAGEMYFERGIGESLSSLRQRAFDVKLMAMGRRGGKAHTLIAEFIAGACGKSRGLPGRYTDEARRRDDGIRAAVAAGTRRGRREKEWGARRLSMAAIQMAND